LGRHHNGCRIGFDLGASDRKVAALIDGRPVFSDETAWDPRSQSDPQWHFDQIMDSLKKAAAHLPRVDAIGGSSAGVYVNNRVQVASLFRGVPEELFNRRVKTLFLEIKKAWNNMPFEVVNDGEVTALAGSMSIGDNAVLGLAMGSSQAVGYVTNDGNIMSWLNELAFAPVDYNPAAPVDEWSGDYGCGAQIFATGGRTPHSQGRHRSERSLPPEKLVEVQKRMASGDERAARIYERSVLSRLRAGPLFRVLRNQASARPGPRDHRQRGELILRGEAGPAGGIPELHRKKRYLYAGRKREASWTSHRSSESSRGEVYDIRQAQGVTTVNPARPLHEPYDNTSQTANS
jgi:hypothetical protein